MARNKPKGTPKRSPNGKTSSSTKKGVGSKRAKGGGKIQTRAPLRPR